MAANAAALLDDEDIRLSADARRAESTPIGFAFYNVGIQNNEVGSQNWKQKVGELASDILDILSKDNVDAVFSVRIRKHA